MRPCYPRVQQRLRQKMWQALRTGHFPAMELRVPEVQSLG